MDDGMMESILISIKKLLGIDANYNHFDPDVIMCINTALSILTQIGVGPESGFSIQGDEETWADFILNEPDQFSMVKSYVHMKVRLLFDSSTMSSSLIDATNKMLSEFEWRLRVAVDYVKNQGEEDTA